MMASIKGVPICKACCATNNNHRHCYYYSKQIGLSESGSRNLLNLRVQNKWECRLGGVLTKTQTATTPVEENDKPSVDGNGETQITETRGFHRDLQSLPRPLSAIDLSSSLSDGSKVRVAYQGLPGAYSEAAALKAYPKCETVPCDEFEAVFKAVELWLHIVGEVQLVVNHCLLGLPGVRKEELKRVLSHPQALDQCEMTLNKLGVTKVSTNDSAGAAQITAAERVRDTGAIASVRAAEIYGLDVLAERIQDDTDNITRFLILAREPIIPGSDRPHKTSIVFSLEEGPGVLFKALAVFALRNINLSKIESRPQRYRPLRIVDDSNKGSAKYFDYLFYVDFEASMAEPRAQYALAHLQEIAKFLRVLGCYPIDTTL
ncbi:arogenate dehydratase/prephenate dehydratase 1, chloroplastic isoform X2 [Coffea eugenioides]|uniref:arogenate dehydratase/prephenate dehydratase 1, chloroplastic isoform X2 n=1 Tax=Coffea eugenioides TaxID=49369 RepID=UPI000F6158FD|nr:arogenate dehydratase/prephenate dehydratase 1, chloroplastic isoform X2 [Coffea eugenioides]